MAAAATAVPFSASARMAVGAASRVIAKKAGTVRTGPNVSMKTVNMNAGVIMAEFFSLGRRRSGARLTQASNHDAQQPLNHLVDGQIRRRNPVDRQHRQAVRGEPDRERGHGDVLGVFGRDSESAGAGSVQDNAFEHAPGFGAGRRATVGRSADPD